MCPMRDEARCKPHLRLQACLAPHLLLTALAFLFGCGDNVLYLLFTGWMKRHLFEVALDKGTVG